MPTPLEPASEQRRLLTADVTEFLDSFYESLPQRRLFGEGLAEEERAELLKNPTDEGRPMTELMDLLALADRPGMLNPSGGHMAYIPNGGTYSGALANFLASGLNRYTGVDVVTPGFADLENSVLRWMEELFELPVGESASVLLSGGSMANFTALVAARTAKLPEDFLEGRIYTTSHAHHSAHKAARLAGFPERAIRTIGVDEHLRMDPDHLAHQIESDRAEGGLPFMVIASAGTTDSGTVDPLVEIGAVASERGLWFHVDAAYGGFFQLTERGRKMLAGIGAADSITLDPHKGLSSPFGVGALLVKDGMALYEANHGKGAYLQDQPENAWDFANLSPELTRPFRGLEIWLPLHLHGVSAYRSELDSSLDLARHAYASLKDRDWIDRIWEPDLSIVAFQCHDDAGARAALANANESGKVALSSTAIDGRFTLRLAILNRRTTLEHVNTAIALLEDGYQG